MSAFIEVEHVTSYRYAQPVEFSKHRVMFCPRAAHDIRVLHASLEVLPSARQQWVHDVFSNSVAWVEPLVSADELRLTARFTIEHFGVRNLELEVDPEAREYPFQYSPDDRLDLATFLPLQYPDDAPTVSDWVKQFMPDRGVIHSRDLLCNLAEGILADLTYSSREAMGTQHPAETLTLKSGTCRDDALLMIEAARGLGFAARFVSGYLYDPSLDGPTPVELGTSLQQGARQIESLDGCEVVEGAGANHAWCTSTCPAPDGYPSTRPTASTASPT